MSTVFKEKKRRILQQLETPAADYTDLSPKGSIDVGIRGLIDELNTIPTLVTTSSCGGRVSIYVEGQKRLQDGEDEIVTPSSGGKGGGRWLFVSHDPVITNGALLSKFGFVDATEEMPAGISTGHALVHFKFEAMILHVMAASLDDAKHVLAAASSAGFRESGVMGFTTDKDGSTHSMVAVRSNGLALDAVVGYVNKSGTPVCIVAEAHLQLLNSIAIERFKVNTERIERFREALLKAYMPRRINRDSTQTEDAISRRARKKAEGLARQEELRGQKTSDI